MIPQFLLETPSLNWPGAFLGVGIAVSVAAIMIVFIKYNS